MDWGGNSQAGLFHIIDFNPLLRTLTPFVNLRRDNTKVSRI
jgi:hypothetical protein